ncbi:putative cucumisin [Helianthus debilis subsp. tardiflorus]
MCSNSPKNMEIKRTNLLPEVLLLVLTFTTIFAIASANSDQTETYIVHLNAPDGVRFDKPEDRRGWYNSFLKASTADLNVKPSLIHAYHNVFTGFAAKLTADQVKAMENMDGFVSARRERVYKLHTTHTPTFLGLHQNLGVWNGSNYGKGIIIGVLDTGITPGHPSFHDKDVPPPPAKWKGECDGSWCNNKLIGARDFTNSTGTGSPVDEEGHGTHTSSTAAGNFVDGANVFGQANGTAAGMAPLAHVAMYKVCDDIGCFGSAILAGMDAAIDDGVDVLSLSLGGASVPFYEDAIAVGAFSAIRKGIFVSCSAGNAGPVNASLSNEAPWILTVGASTVDRSIRATVYLGNKDLLDGESLFQPKDFPQDYMPLVYPGLNSGQDAAWCAPGSLNDVDVKGKVVLCDRGGNIARITKGQTVKDAGGAAMILANGEADGDTTEADAHVLPASHVAYDVGITIKTYINSTSSPVATIIFGGTVIGGNSAPAVASFSSRGPSLASPGIVKPDIIGPGVSILAAWPVSVENSTQTKATFNMISGTSMSCPHLSGISALIKSAHPDWSPAAIKSAIMTTADKLNVGGQPIKDERDLAANIFATGAGHVNPSKAINPGLIFDIQPDDYIHYLCGLGYTSIQVGVIVQKKVTCTEVIPEAQLNYPSYAVTLAHGEIKNFTRTVTNVGEANSTYIVTYVALPIGLDLLVHHAELQFSEVNQKLNYTVMFIRDQEAKVQAPYGEGYITWSSIKHTLIIPFSVKFV